MKEWVNGGENISQIKPYSTTDAIDTHAHTHTERERGRQRRGSGKEKGTIKDYIQSTIHGNRISSKNSCK